jgi:hypothetical protein
MQATLDDGSGTFRALVERIVTSPQFRNKRVDAETLEGLR